MDLTLKQGPKSPLVILEDLKLHLRVDHDDEDLLISSLGEAALAHLDGPQGVLGRCIQPQVWLWHGWAEAGRHRLPLPGVTEVSGIDQTSPAEPVSLALDPRRRGAFTEISLAQAGQVSIEFTAQTPKEVWPVIKTAILLLVGHWYENREAVVIGMTSNTLPIGVDRLLSPLKMRWV